MCRLCRLIKAGVLAKRLSPQVSRMSALAELVGYAGSLAFGAFQLLLLRHQEASVQRRLLRLPQVAASLLLATRFPKPCVTIEQQHTQTGRSDDPVASHLTPPHDSWILHPDAEPWWQGWC